MKLILLVIFSIILIPNILLSNETVSKEYFETQLLINQGLDENMREIFELSSNLNFTQKLHIYKNQKKSPYLPAAGNLILGFGIGSWLHDDETGGWIGTLGQGIPLLLLISEDDGVRNAGASLFIISRLTSTVLPFIDSHNYNKKLKMSLGMSALASNIFMPTSNLAQNTIYPKFSISYKF